MSDTPLEFRGASVPFPGGLYRAYGLRAVDGDTITVVIDLGLAIYRTETIRVAGVNTPELHARDAGERAQATLAREFVAQRTEGQVFRVQTYKPPRETEKYGRYLADVLLDTGSLAALLIAEGLGVPYLV